MLCRAGQGSSNNCLRMLVTRHGKNGSRRIGSIASQKPREILYNGCSYPWRNNGDLSKM
jgi:hypothetical protein